MPFKGIVHPHKLCHLLTLKLFQTCLNRFLLLSTNKDILKNVSNQTVDGLWKSRVGYPHSSKYVILCSAEERNSYRFGTTWVWVNDDIIFILGWTIPLSIVWFKKAVWAIFPLNRDSSKCEWWEVRHQVMFF